MYQKIVVEMERVKEIKNKKRKKVKKMVDLIFFCKFYCGAHVLVLVSHNRKMET